MMPFRNSLVATAVDVIDAIITVYAASSVNVPLGPFAAAGQWCILMCQTRSSFNDPTGWTVLNNSAGFGGGGAVFTKQLTSGDIAAGSVTLTTAASGVGSVARILLPSVTSIRASGFARNFNNAVDTVTTSSTPRTGDLLLAFGGQATGDSVLPSISQGTTLASDNSNFQALTQVNKGTVGSNGAISTVFDFHPPKSTDSRYAAVLVLASPASLGTEALTDTGFDNPAAWSATGGWSISGSAAVGSGASDRLAQSGRLTNGQTYFLSFPYTYTGPNPAIAKLRIRTEANNDLYTTPTLGSGSGNIAAQFVADGTDLRIEADAAVFTGTIPSISCKPVLP